MGGKIVFFIEKNTKKFVIYRKSTTFALAKAK